MNSSAFEDTLVGQIEPVELVELVELVERPYHLLLLSGFQAFDEANGHVLSVRFHHTQIRRIPIIQNSVPASRCSQ